MIVVWVCGWSGRGWLVVERKKFLCQLRLLKRGERTFQNLVESALSRRALPSLTNPSFLFQNDSWLLKQLLEISKRVYKYMESLVSFLLKFSPSPWPSSRFVSISSPPRFSNRNPSNLLIVFWSIPVSEDLVAFPPIFKIDSAAFANLSSTLLEENKGLEVESWDEDGKKAWLWWCEWGWETDSGNSRTINGSER